MINTKDHFERLLEVAKEERMDPEWIKIVPSIREYVNSLPGCPYKENSYTRIAKFVMFNDQPHIIIRERINEDEIDVVKANSSFRGIDQELLQGIENDKSFLLFLLLHEITHLVHLQEHREKNLSETERENDCDMTALTKLKKYKL